MYIYVFAVYVFIYIYYTMDRPNEVPAEHQAWFKLCEAM